MIIVRDTSIQTIPQCSPAASLGGAIGGLVGAGLAFFIGHKIRKGRRKQHQARTSKGLEAMGYSPSEAAQIAQLDSDIVKEVVKGKVEAHNQQSGVTLQLCELQIMNERLALQKTVTYAGLIFVFCVLALVAYRVLKK